VRVVTTLLVGLALAVLVVGVTLYPLLHPTFTRVLSERYSLVQEAGISQTSMLSAAEKVREFVADGDVASLPATVDARAGFDAAAVSHLRDVQTVVSGARTVTGLLAAILVVWLGWELWRQRLDRIAPALLAGAGFCVAIVVLGAVAGIVNFDVLFERFHGLFFSAGTWQFPADSLLIQAFPEQFWSTAAAVWAGLILLGGALLATAGMLVRNGVRGASA
jgi:integral membrane protein (TIGR01906 family)